LKAEELVWNADGGIKYLIARTLGLKMGADRNCLVEIVLILVKNRLNLKNSLI